MTKPSDIRKKFIKANDRNYQLILNFRNSLLSRKLSEVSIYEYSKSVYKLMIFLQEKEIDTYDLTTDIFIEFIDSLENIGASRKLKIISNIKVFYQLQRDRRYIKSNPIDAFDTNELRIQLNAEKMKREQMK